jgi:Rad3-related DNA helicase
MIWNKESQGIQFSDLKKTADVVAEIASHYPNHKGLILPYTDGIESAVVDILSDNHPEIAARLVQHTKNPKEREDVLEGFKKDDSNGILISTYANQGYDNKDIKFVIICKLPFLSLGDTKVQLKMKKSEKWYQTKTVQTIMQQYGRAMRSKDDWGHVYLVDAHFSHWYQTRNIASLMPKYIKEALK